MSASERLTLADAARTTWDVAVVGGGPAGSTCAAILAAETGKSVVLFEREAVPRHNPGETLTSAVHGVLARLGARADVDAGGFVPLRHVKLYLANRTIACPVGPIGNLFRPADDHGLGVRRDEFDAILMAAAEKRGVRVVRGARVQRVETDERQTTLHLADGEGSLPVRARYVVAAEGRGSVCARQLDLRKTSAPERLAIHRYYSGVRGLHEVAEGYVEAPLFVSVAPVGPDRVAVFASSSLKATPNRAAAIALFEKILAGDGPLATRLRGATPLGKFTSHAGFPYGFRALSRGTVLLVGDAAAANDPITTSGVTLAMREAEWAADAIAAVLRGHASRERSFAAYERRVRRLLLARSWFNEALFRLGESRALLDVVAARIDKNDEVRDLFFGVFQGVIPVSSLLRPAPLRSLVWS